MKFEKLIASFLAALMTLLTAVSPILAATALGTFPTFLTKTTDSVTSLDAYIVVGSTAKPEDIVAAADIAATLGSSSSYKLGTTTETSSAGLFVRDGISLCTASASAATCNLTNAASGLTAFPTGNLTNSHFSGLKSSVVTWEGTDYDYNEKVDVSGVYLSHNLGTSDVNGTETIIVPTSAPIKYMYVFTKEFNFTAKDATKGSITSPQYTYPYKFKLLGKDFTLVGVGATSVKMLSGSTGTATATKSVDYGNYKFYATIGSTNAMQIDVKDLDGNAVETILFTGITSGTVATKSTTKTSPLLDVSITSFGTLTDGTVIGCDLVVGPTSTTTKEYDGTADVETTGSANDAFPGAARWGILYHPAGTGADLKIPAGSWIEVRYMPSTQQYLRAGDSIALPNDYATLKFEGWNTDKFSTITVKPYGSTAAYTVTNKTTVAFSDAYGFEISSGDMSSIGSSSGNYFDKAYILFSPKTTGSGDVRWPAAVGFRDKTTGKVLVNDKAPGNSDDLSSEYKYISNMTSAEILEYNFTLSYGGVGENSFRLSFNINATTDNPATVTVNWVVAGVAGSERLDMDFRQVSSGSAGGSWGTSAPQFMLGNTSTTGEDAEILAKTDGSWANAGKKSKEVVTDDGFLLQDTSSSSSSNAVTFKIPSKTLAVKVSFGKATGTTETTGTYKEAVVITSPVTVLDSEVTATHKAKDLILVGGPCVNTIAQSLVDSGKLSANYTCAGGVLGSAWSTDVGYIIVVDDGFTTGQQVMLVAGTKAAQTRTAALVLQQYKDLLTGLTCSSYKVTAATAAGITAV